jgi:hypothetical protein
MKIIGSPMVTHVEHAGERNTKKKIDVQSIDIDEEDNTFE